MVLHHLQKGARGRIMQRYMISKGLNEFSTASLFLSGDHYHHMKNVMRFKPGTKVYVTDPNSYSCIGEIIEYTSEKQVILKWVADEGKNNELPIDVTIACGLPKGDKLDLIIQKSTELGVNTIIPFSSDYSIVKWDESKKKKKQQRFQKITQEAAEQAHRQAVPKIEILKTMDELLTFSNDYQFKLVAYEEDAKAGEQGAFAKTLQQMKRGERLLIIFGPEGGLSPAEIDKFREKDFLTCGLGPRILRTETAPLYALSAISYQFELLNRGD